MSPLALWNSTPTVPGAAVLAALAKLAAAVAAELVADGLTIIGVTGSSGKTSTKDLLAAVLDPLGQVIAPPGSFNNELGHPWTVLRATPDTDYLILEMSARHPGNIAALAAIAPPADRGGAQRGTAHLGEFGSREAIANTKAELPQAVPASGVVILNVDDIAVAAMADETAARVVRVSREPGSEVDVRADRSPSTIWPARGSPCTRDGGEVEVALAVHGDHQVGQRVARGGGRAAVRRRPGSGGRGTGGGRSCLAEPDAGGYPRRWVTVINDAYNANPDSMRAGLQGTGVDVPAEPPVTCMESGAAGPCWARWANLGDDAITEHDAIGRFAVRLDVSRLIVVGTGRTMSAMHHGAVMEGPWGSSPSMVDDADAALALLRAELQPGMWCW